MAERPNSLHVGMQGSHEVVLNALLQHPKSLPKGQVAHYVEAVKVEPVGNVEWLALVGLDLIKKLIGVVGNSELVVS